MDFVGPNLSEQDPVDVISSINNGSIVSCDTQYNSVTKGWRVLVRFNVEDNKKPTDIRLQLSSKKSHTIVSETWSGQFPAQ